MKTRVLYQLLSLVAVASLLILPFTSVKSAPVSAAPAAPNVWYGTWQMGPSFDTTLIGCPVGNGFARITGEYYPPQNRVYFLGARCEDNATYGSIFYFDLDTRTYADTGVDLPVPVSNYIIATIPNDGAGNGPGLYIVGGRTNDGGQTNAVQVYYPNTNTVATITSDPFPPDPSYSPGSVVYAGGKLYVFGGFDGVTMFNTTWAYDPAAAPGSRWTNTGANLPTGRSYIAGVAVGNLIYAIGGDELPALTPINDTVVLDVTNLAAGWQDAAMADLPVVNGDAPAVYVNEGYLGGTGGGIFVIGGGWPAPGPYRYVYRYDIATDTWEEFPQLVIPAPATGRRNQAAVYVPDLGIKGLGDGQPGIWTFGGYDGSGTNAMTDTSEFFSINVNPVLVLPDALQASGFPGDTVTHTFVLLNETGATDTFDLSYTSDVAWDVTLPTSLGPVPDGGAVPFSMDVAIPTDVTCDTTGTFTVTATSQTNPSISDSQPVTVYAICSLTGVVTDATTGVPIEGAYVWIQNTPDGLENYYDAYTDADGVYSITNAGAGVPPDTYYMGASAAYHQPSFYPDGWPEGAIMIDIGGQAGVQDVSLVSSQMAYDPASFEITLDPGDTATQTLTISNSGSGPLSFFISTVDGAQPEPPPAVAPDMPLPGVPRIDPQIAADIQASPEGVAEFLVVLKSQADLRPAYAIQDWNARGEYVYQTLSQHAARAQKGLLAALDQAGVNYIPLYIINAVIVRNGNLDLVNHLAARSDVAQIVANRRIELEKPIPEQPLSPSAIEWNVTRIKAPSVWSTYGVRGEGIVVAEIDTGTQWDHPALKSKYRGWDGATADHNYNWFDPYGQNPLVPFDSEGHGTHVMGTMVGDDGGTNQIGVAPGAKWISCDGTDNVSGYLLTDQLLQCAQWIVAPTDLNGNNPDPSKRPHVVNNSWGGGHADYWYTGAVDAWRAAGIFPQFSNGNSGPACETAGSPGDNWNIFSAGASDINNNIASFSSRGPAQFYGFLKPDITAPGVNVRSSVPNNAYASYSGTSMASPHVAASIALLWSANPELMGQIDLSGWLLQQTAVPKTTSETCGGIPAGTVPNNTWGYGLLDVFAAVERAQAGGVTTDWLSVSPMSGYLEPGETTEVVLDFHPSLTMSGAYTGTLWLVADDPVNHDVRLPITLYVNPPELPVAGFTTNSPVILGEPMVFTNTSTGSEPLDFLWDFGDGVTSTLTNPTHLYAVTGTFTVTLTAANLFGEDSVSQAVEVLEPIPPTAAFESNSPITLGETAVFTNTSTGSGALSFEWDFGDGVTSTLENPTHLYLEVGVFNVTLTVTSPFGSDSVTHEFVVKPVEFVIYLPLVPQIFTPE